MKKFNSILETNLSPEDTLKKYPEGTIIKVNKNSIIRSTGKIIEGASKRIPETTYLNLLIEEF